MALVDAKAQLAKASDATRAAKLNEASKEAAASEAAHAAKSVSDAARKHMAAQLLQAESKIKELQEKLKEALATKPQVGQCAAHAPLIERPPAQSPPAIP
jgi:hypothetical protein